MFKKTALLSAGLIFSSQALSHAGHDHSAWDAGLIHLLTYAAIAGVISVGAYIAYKKRQAKSDK